MFYDPEISIWKHNATKNRELNDISKYDFESFPDDFTSLKLTPEMYEKF